MKVVSAIWFGLTVLVGLAIQLPASAQPLAEEEACVADYGRVRCGLDEWDQVSEYFQLPDALQLQAEGWRGVRVYTIDGYSRLMPMVSVLWTGEAADDRDASGRLEVRGVQTMTDAYVVRALERRAWWRAIDHAERALELAASAPAELDYTPMQDDEGNIFICLHPWSAVAEILTAEGVSRLRRGGCQSDELLFEVLFDFSDLALNGFGHCNYLDPDLHRNESARLSRCLDLEGQNLVGAAEVANIVDAIAYEQASDLGPLADPLFLLEWEQDPRLIGDLARQRIETELVDSQFWSNLVSGDEGIVHVFGVLERGEDRSAVRQSWRRDATGQWRLFHMLVSPPTPPEDL